MSEDRFTRVLQDVLLKARIAAGKMPRTVMENNSYTELDRKDAREVLKVAISMLLNDDSLNDLPTASLFGNTYGDEDKVLAERFVEERLVHRLKFLGVMPHGRLVTEFRMANLRLPMAVSLVNAEFQRILRGRLLR